MKVFNMSHRKFETLKPLELPQNIFNGEARMYLISEKNRWNTNQTVLKRYHITSGEIFSNKLYTINELLDKKDEINIDELVMPSALAAIEHEIVGFTMPYIPNYNFQEVLDSTEFSLEQKVAYFKEIGELLERLRKVRKYTSVKDFYLNDIHENNFILNKVTGKINVVDLDSSKIGHNYTGASRYLSPLSQLPLISKYQKLNYSVGGSFEVNENTEIYCYIIMVFRYFYGYNIGELSIPDFYNYLEYLSQLGVSKELLDKLNNIYIGKNNENPYELIEELVPYYDKMHKRAFDAVRKRVK